MNIFKRYALRNLLRAKGAISENNATAANQFARKAVRMDKNLEEGWLILAATGTDQNAIGYLNKVLKINPQSERARRGLAWALSKLSDDDKQEKRLQKANVKASIGFGVLDTGEESFTQIGLDLRKNERSFFRIIFHRWQSIFALLLVSFIFIIAALAPVLSPIDDPTDPQFFKIVCDKFRCSPEPPSNTSPFGTIKEFDVYHTVIWGTRQSLFFGISTAVFTAIIGSLLGSLAAYTGGWLDKIIMRICDAFLAFPIAAAVALFAQVIVLLNPTTQMLALEQLNTIPQEPSFIQTLVINTDPILLALILFSWMPYARIIHAQVLNVKQSEYVEAARAVGARHRRIIWKHILPNSLSPMVVMGTRDIGRMVVVQASLTFIGVGGSSAWAILLNTGKDWIIGPGGDLFTRWWIYLPITLAVVIFGISWSLLGDEINHWMNPKNI
jgi:peptide/nickel transport system permease protein